MAFRRWIRLDLLQRISSASRIWTIIGWQQNSIFCWPDVDFHARLCYAPLQFAADCRRGGILVLPDALCYLTRISRNHYVQVLVRDNNVDQALRALKKKMQREGIFREMKMRGHYEKP